MYDEEQQKRLRHFGRVHSPDLPKDKEVFPVCTEFAHCAGCTIPRNGFVCWHKDGTCLRTDMEKYTERGR